MNGQTHALAHQLALDDITAVEKSRDWRTMEDREAPHQGQSHAVGEPGQGVVQHLEHY